MNQFVISLDIGGTTFSSYLIDNNFEIKSRSSIDKISNYSNKDELYDGIENQISLLINNYNISFKNISCLGISAPGPLDSKKGLILETPNLLLLQNASIIKDMNEKFSFPIFLENDANLFALGEWYSNYRKSNVIAGITLGSGLGLGIIINGKLFRGAHGMGAEYGISPYEFGVWEDTISIEGIENLTYKKLNKEISPQDLFELASEGNPDAKVIWNEFGMKLGIFTSHILNILDPSVVSFGGGISKAFPFFSNTLINKLKEFSPTYNYNNTLITYSKSQLDSTHIGSAIYSLDKV